MARRKRNRELAEARTEDEVKALVRIDQLAEAVAERLSDSERARWTGLAVGLGFATLIGLIGVAIYLFFRRDRDQGQAVLGGASPVTIINQLPSLGKAVKKVKKVKKQDADTALADASSEGAAEPPLTVNPISAAPDMPSRPVRLAPNAALRVASAGSSAWRVMLRTVGPPGTYAMIAGDARALRARASGTSIVRAGASQEVRLAPGEILYGMGSDAGVALAVITAEPVALPALRVVR